MDTYEKKWNFLPKWNFSQKRYFLMYVYVCVCKDGLCGTKMVGLLECKNCSWPFHSVGHFCAGENYSRKKSYTMGGVDKKIPKCITESKNSYAHQALQHRFNSTAEQ